MINRTGVIIVSISLLLVILLIIFVGRPFLRLTIKDWINLKTAQSEVHDLEKQKEALNNLKQDKAKLVSFAQQASYFLPETKEISSFVSQLEKINQESGMKFLNVTSQITTKKKAGSAAEEEVKKAKEASKETTTQTKEETKVIQEASLSTGFEGNFPQSLDLLSRLERAARFSTVTELSLSRSSEGVITTKLTLTIYYKPKVSIARNLGNLQIDWKKQELFSQRIYFGTVLSPQTEATGGRPDPFAPF